jgi:hypothetical protein
MSTKFYRLIPYHLQDHNIQSWKKEDFFLCARGAHQCFGGQKNHFLEKIWIEGLQILVPR